MAPKTTREVAKYYLELLTKARSWKQHLEIIAAWHAKHLRAVYDRKDDLQQALKAHNIKV